MSRIQKKLIVTLIVLCGLVVVFSTKLWSVGVFKRAVDCGEIGLQTLDATSGEAVCDKRYFIFGKYYTVRFTKRPSPNPLKYAITDSHNNYNITGQIVTPPAGTFIVTDIAREHMLWTSSAIGTEWSGATRALIEFSGNAKQYMLNEIQEFTYELTFTPKNSDQLHTYFVRGVTLLACFCLLTFFVGGSSVGWMKYAILMTGLALMVLWYGMPYGTSAGWFDTGDDTSYMHWAYNLGYLLDPDLTHTPSINSWAFDHNHHSWGTGLLLAPFVMLARLKGSGMNPGTLHFGLMNFAIVFYGLAAVLLSFKTFRLFSGWRAAIVMALLTIVSTSMIRWMFMRNLFSHVPEFFCLAVATYCAAQRYYNERIRTDYFVLMLGSLFLATQVRRENAALFGVIIAYEFLLRRSDSFKVIAKRIGFVALTMVASIVVLMATNHFTKLKAFFGDSYTQNDFLTTDMLKTFLTQGPEVFYRESYGLFYWKNAYPWLALGACLVYIRSWRWWLPLAGVTLLYLLMCTFYRYPNGFEWQNRLLLKLTPILFGGALVFLNRVPLPLKMAGWIWLIAGAVVEVESYWNQIPKRMSFYHQDLSDHQIMYPQSWPGPWMSIFYLPLIFAWGMAGILWLKVYWDMRRKAQS